MRKTKKERQHYMFSADVAVSTKPLLICCNCCSSIKTPTWESGTKEAAFPPTVYHKQQRRTYSRSIPFFGACSRQLPSCHEAWAGYETGLQEVYVLSVVCAGELQVPGSSPGLVYLGCVGGTDHSVWPVIICCHLSLLDDHPQGTSAGQNGLTYTPLSSVLPGGFVDVDWDAFV